MLEKLEKENLGLAGEYAVASELCRMGCYTQLTLGNHKNTDLLVEISEKGSEIRMIRVSVKTKQGRDWVSYKGPQCDDEYIVFVDFAKKSINEKPDFYILNAAEWKELLDNVVSDENSKGYNTSLMEGGSISRKGKGEAFKSVTIKLSMIANHKSWDEIKSKVKSANAKKDLTTLQP